MLYQAELRPEPAPHVAELKEAAIPQQNAGGSRGDGFVSPSLTFLPYALCPVAIAYLAGRLLDMRLDEPELLVDAARDFREDVRRVRIARIVRLVDVVAERVGVSRVAVDQGGEVIGDGIDVRRVGRQLGGGGRDSGWCLKRCRQAGRRVRPWCRSTRPARCGSRRASGGCR